MAVVIALLIAGVVSFVPGVSTAVTSGFSGAVCSVTTLSSCTSDVTAAPVDQGHDSTDPSREDAARDARDSNRDGAGDTVRRDDDDTESDPGGGTPGDSSGGPELGTGVPGTNPPAMPSPPPWEPGDEVDGVYNSEPKTVELWGRHKLIEALANGAAINWPNASRNLLHFLGNSGDPLEQDVDLMLSANSSLSDRIDAQRDLIISSAVARAQESGTTGPMTFPINTSWASVNLNDRDWFLALGGISYNQTGHVTVYPPTTAGGEWTYSSSTAVNIRDRYNWDANKSTNIGPFNFEDSWLADLHEAGLAQHYTAVGQSSRQEHQGSAP